MALQGKIGRLARIDLFRFANFSSYFFMLCELKDHIFNFSNAYPFVIELSTLKGRQEKHEAWLSDSQ